MSLALYMAIENARVQLEVIVPAFAAGKVDKPEHVHGIGILFRQIGVCRLLTDGIAEPLFVSQMQAASCYEYGLSRMPEEDKVTSLAACLWDALAGLYWQAAYAIAQNSRRVHNVGREHEDDFLRVAFLCRRYLLDRDSRDESEHRESQAKLLDRWEQVLDGADDPRLDICRALFDSSAEQFNDGFERAAEQRREKLSAKQKDGSIRDEQAAWLVPFWPEGLAFLRLAGSEGMALYEDYPMVPMVTRIANPLVYDANSWRTVDYHPKTQG